ncbi:SDR family oxidoreductase [Actinospica durhamensis]|uniref:SDR family oxidoreductase n=1 Tax=Actinospica durhamensis TaxID=1508375 RepID=A0A941EK20_9ACTN|nr:SDR family NAD(P)-dependent oxidoreductase [Actinospica durhamensis]MBR7831783.1 SDR family oxidoreductase [Actinospica durhamensis]
MNELADQVALVTGATRGIGYAVAAELASHGARVIAAGRDEDTAARCARTLSEQTGTEVSGCVVDVSEFGSVAAAVRAAVAPYGRLDILVANAGIMDSAPLGAITEPSLRAMYDTNVAGTIACLQAASRIMVRRGSGSMVVLASIVGRDGSAGQVGYSASKAAIAAAARSAAKELGRWGIRVNAVAPGIIETDLISGIPEQARERYAQSTPLGRLGTPADVAKAVRFLVSEDAGFITGQVLGIDGGLVL